MRVSKKWFEGNHSWVCKGASLRRKKVIQNLSKIQLLDWMPKTFFGSSGWFAWNQLLGIQKLVFDTQSLLFDTQKLFFGNSTGWSKNGFGHPIQNLVLDSFWTTFFRRREPEKLSVLYVIVLHSAITAIWLSAKPCKFYNKYILRLLLDGFLFSIN